MGLKERSEERRRRMVGHVAHSFKEAEEWDLEFWRSRTPEERIQAYFAILEDVELVQRARAESWPAAGASKGRH